MPSFQITASINKSPEIVVESFINPKNMPFYTVNLEKFETIKGIPGEIGSIGHLHYLENGKRYVMEDTLLYADPGKKYISKVTGVGMSIQVTTTFTAIDTGTLITLKWEGKGSNLIMKILLKLNFNILVRGAQAELDKFKELVEIYGKDFPLT